MKLLALTKYGPLGASSRMRTLQYVPALRGMGWSVDIAPLLDDGYVRALYSGSPKVLHVLRAYGRRFRQGATLRNYDVVLVEKEMFPWLPWFIESMLLSRCRSVVVDYDDAIFHQYDLSDSGIVRAFLGQKIDRVMASADAVVVGNDYLSERATKAGCRRVEWIPTVIDASRYFERSVEKAPDSVTVGWIGTPSTAKLLKPLFPVFADIARETGVRFQAIGARADQLDGSPFEAVEWSEDREVSLLSSLDIGIMPLQDEPWQRGKCGYKLIQYMACGLPVVASPVGVNASLVSHGRDGYLASTESEWKNALIQLIDSVELRRRMGREGASKVRRTYTLQAQAPRLAKVLESVVAERAPM